jgi:hypothetical protein
VPIGILSLTTGHPANEYRVGENLATPKKTGAAADSLIGTIEGLRKALVARHKRVIGMQSAAKVFSNKPLLENGKAKV